MQYFSQWQRLPVNPETWQQGWGITAKDVYPRKIMLAYNNSHCDNVLNIGCGIFNNPELYTTEHYGVDVTPKFVKEAHKRTDAAVASAEHLPFIDNSFNAVICENLLLHLPPYTYKTVIDEMFRVSSKIVAFNEPPWKDNTRYICKERYGDLTFFNNCYGKKEMINYLSQKNVFFHVWWDKEKTWQVTVMEKQ
jgi:ubiquinone/menaquinone biosynthesis C-methylase UbiE